jgi:hypothetical protein
MYKPATRDYDKMPWITIAAVDCFEDRLSVFEQVLRAGLICNLQSSQEGSHTLTAKSLK